MSFVTSIILPLPAILGFFIGLIWIVQRLGWLERIKIYDRYRIAIPVLATIFLPIIFTYISLNFNSIKELTKELAQLGIFFTIAIGFLNYFWNQKIKLDEETTKQAILALERAYDILTDNGKNIAPPLPDRYNWLATARMLARYELPKKRLKTDLYKIICEEQEEYWIHKFYLLLVKNYTWYGNDYFEDTSEVYEISGKKINKPIISLDSAVIIFGFAVLGFPGNGEINVNDINKISDKLAGSLLMHNNLNKYLKQFDNLEDNLFSKAFRMMFPKVLSR
jgi:hypothetical protein